jgi:hypothetical protein
MVVVVEVVNKEVIGNGSGASFPRKFTVDDENDPDSLLLSPEGGEVDKPESSEELIFLINSVVVSIIKPSIILLFMYVVYYCFLFRNMFFYSTFFCWSVPVSG